MKKKIIETQVNANAEKTVDDLFGMLHQEGRIPASIEEMDAAIRKKAQKISADYADFRRLKTQLLKNL